ncbi:MAG TPA: Na+/H+ antiporter NhaA [Bacteroidia bacterium]|nr:Na+/H+ antiporter NhaA [Bacteroidia bacterium]
MRKSPVERWVLDPINSFINNSTASGIVLFSSAIIALILSNSVFSHQFHQIWETHFAIKIGSFSIDKSLHHWINDGLMSMFFFVVGLELKRELIAGDLSNPRKALLPIAAAIGGMVLPAILYLTVNHGSSEAHGWGIPMATDIAFALGVIYLLGDRIPLSLKVFLTALAIIDDLGAVLVIAFFYTSDISMISLFTGIGIMLVLLVANKLGVRSALFYGIIGIAGLWTAFLMSGIHATIAAVLAAFTIPADVKMSEVGFIERIEKLLDKFRKATPNEVSLVTSEQLHIVEDIVVATKDALTPLQRLEHAMHPIVAFVVMPVFALANAGATFQGPLFDNLSSPVSLGILLGLYIGKSAGIFGAVFLAVKTGITSLPDNTTWKQFAGLSFLGGIGFTMSLFITSLAFKDPIQIENAKISILFASVLAGITGYILLRLSTKPNTLS